MAVLITWEKVAVTWRNGIVSNNYFRFISEVHLVSTADTARSMGADLFIEALTSVGLDQMLLEGNYTLFAPLDNAFRDLMPKQTHVSVWVSW